MSKNWQNFQTYLTVLLPRLPSMASLFKNFDIGSKHRRPADFFEASLIYLFGENHPSWTKAKKFLAQTVNDEKLSKAVQFIQQAKRLIKEEIENADASYFANLKTTISEDSQLFLKTWQIFFPEGVEIYQEKEKVKQRLLAKRRVTIVKKNDSPIKHPARQILFTANVLLRPPLGDVRNLTSPFKEVVENHGSEPQKYWYDHPIPLDAPAENNEILYGLNGLDQALDFEKKRGNLAKGQKVTCVLSCSVTHPYLHQVAKPYVRKLIQEQGGFNHLEPYLLTEADCQQIIEKVLKPAANQYLSGNAKEEDFAVLGTDGEYGRHYTFLKAMAAWWHVLIDSQIEATFKIDLDQVFPQEELVRETGRSALELLKTDLWGAEGKDFRNRSVHLGMIAGALVNARDINQSLFTPDVLYPGEPQTADEYIFFSKLPQALSTEVEMMSRYNQPELDGKNHCLQRVHVTGGTNGILVKALFAYRPFTPSFIGRAEDQAFILSVFNNHQSLLRYVHQPGLIMRHDKELFAQEAIRAAELGKVIGDYQRMLYFSAYAKTIDQEVCTIKEELAPFTGSFISYFPVTVVLLRFLLKGLALIKQGAPSEAEEFLQIGTRRLASTLTFIEGQPSPLQKQLKKERQSWNRFYDLLQILKEKIAAGDQLALDLQKTARKIINDCAL